MNEEQLLKSRLEDLAKKSYSQNIYTYSNFLNPAELAVFDEISSELGFAGYEIFGGSELSERQMVRFGDEDNLGYDEKWRIDTIKIEPLIDKFSDVLHHSDFLGALMNLGIDRSVLGDIIIKDNKRAYLFCMDKISDFIIENLTKVKHTNVKCTLLTEEENLDCLAPELVELSLIVASPRFDAIVSAVTKCSRNEAVNFFKSKRVLLNGRVCERNSITLKSNDIFSVRGYGKYIFADIGKETRKGKIYVNLKQYK